MIDESINEALQQNSILVIDDNPTNLGVVMSYLEEAGFEVMMARSGEDGLNIAFSELPDLILLDINIPGMDGFEICRQLKANPTTQHVPVIFMTARTHTDDKVTGFKAGGSDYITKPIQQAEMTARIKAHLTIRQLQQKLLAANQKLEQRAADQARRINFRMRLSSQVNKSRDLKTLLITLNACLTSSFAYNYTQIYLVDPETSELTLVKATPDGHQSIPITPEHSVLGLVAQTNQYFLNNEIIETSPFFTQHLLDEIKAVLIVPLYLADRAIGVLDIQSEQANSFSAEDVSMILAIAEEVAVALDNLRLIEEQQIMITQLQTLDQAKSQFLGVISHEFRTPMNAILGYAGLLQEKAYGEFTKEIHNYAQNIFLSGEQQMVLINNLLDLAHIETNQLIVTLRPVTNIATILSEVAEGIRNKIGERPVKVITDIDFDLPPIYADSKRIYQILFNLGDNAAKFTQKGSITFQVKLAKNPPDWVRFAVLDTGIGISPEKQQTIFESFQQVDMSYTRPYGGLGLGLTISQRLAEHHQTQIGLKSEVGVGSEFYFFIPVAKGA